MGGRRVGGCGGVQNREQKRRELKSGELVFAGQRALGGEGSKNSLEKGGACGENLRY